MKTRFNTYDIICMVTELQRLVGMRVNQVYDIDNRSYLIRLQRSEEKSVLLLESGNRFHTTQFEWPKNVAPSGFTMKLRKHLKNKRLEKLTQLGIDRVIDLQFGSGEAAYHVILELYDRGNIVLTDHELTILNVLRPHVEGDKIRFAVKEKYPLDRAKTICEPPLGDALKEILGKSKPGDNLKKILNPNVEYGPSIIDHVLLENGLSGNLKIAKEAGKPGFQVDRDLDKLEAALRLADDLLDKARSEVAKGYITQKKEERPSPDGSPSYLLTNVEFHPMLFAQHKAVPIAEYETFDRAVDEFYSALEGQKIDIKTIQVEREAMKKLSNVRRDHEKRLSELHQSQLGDREKAELISGNQQLVDQARLAVQTALANQMSWDDIQLLVKTAQENDDPVATAIKKLRLDINHITLTLNDPYHGSDDEEPLRTMDVDIDLSLTAFANARRYYDQKRNAAKKQQKTLESQGKALKSAERKTKQTLKEAQAISSISKARKTYWFEKFFWFISSDNLLVIGGRDQQQNELLVKRYLRAQDIYVHADVSGAASVIVKRAGSTPPPRTLLEAGHAAVAYSVAWEAKVLTSAWWVHAHQVSKSAPTGEYLTTGSFMIRGKKNFLLPQQLQLGFGFMFRLEESCIERHKDDRKPLLVDDAMSASDVTSVQDAEEEIAVSDDDDPSEKDDSTSTSKNDIKLSTISEETRIATPHLNTNTAGERGTEDDEKETGDGEKETENGEKETEDTDSDDSSSDGGFPDTHIKVDHGTGQVIMQSKMRTISEISDRSETGTINTETSHSFPALPKKGGKKAKEKQKQKREECQRETVKRGQRGKLKKIKEKYRHQDEDDRAMRLEMLQAASAMKEAKKAQKKTAPENKKKNKAAKIPQPAPQIIEVESDAELDPVENIGTEPRETLNADTELLSQLTGCPVAEDELLFAVPVVAPYSALNNYKYKVKLTPGTSKRGKAAKTAIQVFLKDPTSSSREKDLLKAVREEDTARNFPGKVKLSAPNLHRKK